jgi:hypothetical protein
LVALPPLYELTDVKGADADLAFGTAGTMIDPLNRI